MMLFATIESNHPKWDKIIHKFSMFGPPYLVHNELELNVLFAASTIQNTGLTFAQYYIITSASSGFDVEKYGKCYEIMSPQGISRQLWH